MICARRSEDMMSAADHRLALSYLTYFHIYLETLLVAMRHMLYIGNLCKPATEFSPYLSSSSIWIGSSLLNHSFDLEHRITRIAGIDAVERANPREYELCRLFSKEMQR